jgi:putative flippase GtrA
VAFVVNFGLNRQWAFAAQGAVAGQLSRYLILVVVNLVLTVAGVQGLTWLGLPYLLSKLATSGVVAVINYFAFRLWVFRAAAPPAPDTAARVPAQLSPETVGTESA